MVQNLAFLSIFTIQFHTKPYQMCLNVKGRSFRYCGGKKELKRTAGSKVSVFGHFCHGNIPEL